MKSAERLLAVLQLLAAHARPVPTMTIARECGIPKSSVHHLLNVMRAGHFVTYYEVERAWGLGVSVFEIGSAYLRSAPLQRMGRHLLIELTQRTAETSHLAMLHGTEVLYIDKEQPVGSATKLVTEIGVRLPAHLTAVGRAILPDAIGALNRIRPPFNVNQAALAAALVTLSERAWSDYVVELVRRERTRRLEGTLAALGVDYYPSQANFTTFRPTRLEQFHEALADQGLVVRDGADLGFEGWVRATIGAPPQMALLRGVLTNHQGAA